MTEIISFEKIKNESEFKYSPIPIETTDRFDTGVDYGIMTAKQVARYLRMSQRTVYSLWEQLGGVKFGKALRFRKENIDALFRQEKKQMEGGGQARGRKGYTPVQDKDRSKGLGSRKSERVRKSNSIEDTNRHDLLGRVQ